jgi:protein involved in polysaccharide export with SLBB domain
LIRKILIITILFFPLLALSQELDDNYMDSLPEEVRQEVVSKINIKKELEKPVYRRASTVVDKPITNPDLFGSDFFDTMQTTFMPINEPNLDSSYVLDFGDVLEIQLIGQKEEINTYSISRDGSINFPDIGKIILAGLSLGEASELVKSKIDISYIGTKAFISLKNIRDISILIAGNAFNPGIYTLNGNSNMLQALSIAGGIGEFGSYRDIDLIRNDKIIDTLDIYELLVFGKYNFLSSLRSGDSIVVNSQKSTISLETGVNRRAVYEIKEEDSFSDILRFANGFSGYANLNSISLKRLINGVTTVLKLTEDELYDIKLSNNDSIFIGEYKVNEVTISGAVNNPGNYKLRQGATLSNLLELVGGYDDLAYTFGGYLENQTALAINEEAKTKLYNTFIDNLIINSTSMSDQAITMLIEQLESSETSGRVIAEFDLDVLKSNPSLDTLLENGDEIFIPMKTQQVYIQGKVSNPGATRYTPGENIQYYIDNAGGALESSDPSNIFIIHPNGETQILKSNPKLFAYSKNNEVLIYPGSIIYVPQKTNFSNSLEVAAIWAPIISSIALSMTSLSVLNNTK